MMDRDDLRHIKNKCIGRILAVNDLCPDDEHRQLMRQTVLSNINLAFRDVEDAVNDNQTDP